MSQKVTDAVAGVIKFGLSILPVLTLIVAGNYFASVFLPGVGDLFFPFITGKNFFFRIVVEVLFVLWVFAASFDKKYRPKPSPVFWAVLATVAALTLSTIFGESPYHSFWSNYERMEGLVTHLHLLAYFIILISVLKNERDWRRFFLSFLAVGIITTFYAYLQFAGKLEIHQSGDRLDATLGNATYLAIFIIFNIFVAAYWLFKTDKIWWRSIFAAGILLEAPIVFLTATRGAVLGFLGGAVLLSLLALWLVREKRVRIAALGIIVLVFISSAAFFALKDSDFVQQSYIWKRFADISLGERTVTSRLTIWGMSYEGFKEHPIFGWGPDNFNLVFNKYFKAELWRQEPWFDRSHNVIFDWLAQAGILGLAAYLSIFISALFMLWRKYLKTAGKNLRDAAAPLIFTSLFAAYFFHNFFVFDNLVSYFVFFSVLAFVHYSYSNGQFATPLILTKEKNARGANSIGFVLTPLVVIAIILIMYFVNMKPLLASIRLLDTLKDMSVNGQNVDVIIADFDKVFALNTFGSFEAREQLASYANNAVASGMPQDAKLKVLNKAISEMEKQVAESPKDVRGYLFLATLYSRGGRLDDAISLLAKGLGLSPQKQQVYFLLADAYIAKGQNDKALEVLQKAYDYDTTYTEASKNLAIAAIISGKGDYADVVLENTFKKKIVPDKQLLSVYARVGNYQKALETLKVLIELEPANAQYHVNLAATYLQLGDRASSIKALEEAIKINPQFKEEGEGYINQIKAGLNP